ncbi:COG7 [[Candida] subhashii]|uniref:COG7 n=1 Tax=[Candida] subhashii TaxID=561895 RepID=A0A8J5QJ33_9ASCO|nr:COG7 [[Candida] subhashii]KAG7661837.1 COG7 [[Candida] subhashii]
MSSLIGNTSAGSDSNIEESLTMFFDNNFNPSAYIDKLIQSIIHQGGSTASATPISTYSQSSLSNVSNDISELITHLDYYTNELSNHNLKQKLDTLEKSNALIFPHGINSGDQQEENGGSTRIQYHINILNNSIISLQSELSTINEQIDKSLEATTKNSQPINNLIELKRVKANLSKVVQIFELIKASISKKGGDSENIYTAEEFQRLLDEMYESIKSQLESNKNREKLLAHVDKLIELNSLFVNLSKFNPIFKKFVSKLVSLKDTYSRSRS